MSAADDAPSPSATAPTGRPGDPTWYTRRFELMIYLVAGVTYIGFGMFHKWLLNWVVGPLWLVAWVWAAPALIDRVRRRDAAT